MTHTTTHSLRLTQRLAPRPARCFEAAGRLKADLANLPRGRRKTLAVFEAGRLCSRLSGASVVTSGAGRSVRSIVVVAAGSGRAAALAP